jgi:hypothetical protein
MKQLQTELFNDLVSNKVGILPTTRYQGIKYKIVKFPFFIPPFSLFQDFLPFKSNGLKLYLPLVFKICLI